MKRLFILFIALIFSISATNLLAQGAPKPVKWRMTVKMTSATEGVVTVKATPDEGWHLYGTSLPKGGPKPTELDFSGSTGVKFTAQTTYSIEPLKVHDDMFGLDLTWWDKPVSFKRKFKVTDASKAMLKCAVSFMACNNNTCSAPSTETLTKPIPTAK